MPGVGVRAKGFSSVGWRNGAAVLALLLLFALECRQWPVYLLFIALFFLLRWQPRPHYSASLFDASLHGVLLLDQEARCCYANHRWAALAGLSSGQVLEDDWLSVIHPEDLQAVQTAVKTMQQQESLVALDFRILRADGQILWVSSSMWPAEGYAPAVYQLLIVDFSDLKRQKMQLASSLAGQNHLRAELESILSSSIDPIAALDMQFNFTVLNKGYAALFMDLYGIAVLRHDCFLHYDFHSSDDRSDLITFWGRVLQGETFVVRRALHGKNKQRQVFDMSFSPQLNSSGEQVGAVSVLHDVTLSAQTEQALLRSEELFKAATQSSLDAIYVLEVIKDERWNIKDFHVVEVNKNGFEFFSRQDKEAFLLSRALQQVGAESLFAACCQVFNSKNMFVTEEKSESPYFYDYWFLYQVVAVSGGLVLTVRDVTLRKKSELAMAAFSGLQQAILDSAGSAIIVTDLTNTIRLFNHAAEMMLGYPAKSLIGKETPAVFHQSNAAALLTMDFAKEIGVEITSDFDVFSLQAKRFIHCDWIYQHRDGYGFPVELTMNVVRDQHGEITGYMGIANDISIRKQAELKLQQNEYRTSAILSSLHDCVLTLSFDGLILDANTASLRIFGYDDLKGKSLSVLFPLLGEINPRRGLAKELFSRLGVDTRRMTEVAAVNKSGVEVIMDMALAIVEVEGERVYIATLHDLTQHKLDEQKMQETIEELEALQVSLGASHEQLSCANQELSRLAHMDGLTGLANRRLFDQTLTQEWGRAARNSQCLALVMLDVDFFKRYNDYFGHQAGDECLKRVAAAMLVALHRPGDLVARYGGEEFVLVLPGTDQAGAGQVVEAVLQQVRDLAIEHLSSDVASVVTLSAGVAVMLPLQGVDPYCLVQAADQALYQAKHLGRNCYFVAGSDHCTR